MKKQKVFVVTKVGYEKGQPITNQYVIEARSRKEALEKIVAKEEITVEEVE